MHVNVNTLSVFGMPKESSFSYYFRITTHEMLIVTYGS